MEEKLINDTIKLRNENSIYTIEFEYSSYELINSLIKTRIIVGGSTDESYKTLRFKAKTVKTLNEYLHDKKVENGRKRVLISDAAKMIRSLTVQLNYLIEVESHTILGYNPAYIIVINDLNFAYLNSELVADFGMTYGGDDMAMISCLFSSNNIFASPEILKVKEIPWFTHYKTAYFSLGLLIIYVLLGDDEFYKDFLKNNDSSIILNILNNHPVKNTKIYWLLSRCLVEEPKDRSIILI